MGRPDASQMGPEVLGRLGSHFGVGTAQSGGENARNPNGCLQGLDESSVAGPLDIGARRLP